MFSRYGFASGAEEKVIRVFQAPANFVENFRKLCSIKEDEEGDKIFNGKFFNSHSIEKVILPN